MRIAEYAEGLWADVHGHRADADEIVLLWHGRGPFERDVLEPIASALTTAGRLVVPDWDSTAYDGGRIALVASHAFARAQAALAVVGWSLGVRAAVGLGLRADVLRIVSDRVVSLAGGFDGPDPMTGSPIEVPACPGSPTGFV